MAMNGKGEWIILTEDVPDVVKMLAKVCVKPKRYIAAKLVTIPKRI